MGDPHSLEEEQVLVAAMVAQWEYTPQDDTEIELLEGDVVIDVEGQMDLDSPPTLPPAAPPVAEASSSGSVQAAVMLRERVTRLRATIAFLEKHRAGQTHTIGGKPMSNDCLQAHIIDAGLVEQEYGRPGQADSLARMKEALIALETESELPERL